MFSKQKGVTLVELIVVISIVTIIFTFVVINLRKGEQTNKLQRSAQQIVQGIRQIQNLATSSAEVRNPSSGNNEVPLGGFGVYIKKTSPDNEQYIIFGDFDGDDGYDTGEALTGGLVKLEKGIIVDCIFYNPSSGVPDKTSITIEPVDPLIRVQPEIPPANEIYITIKVGGSGCGNTCANESTVSSCQKGQGGCPKDCKVVKITKAGWVIIVE